MLSLARSAPDSTASLIHLKSYSVDGCCVSPKSLFYRCPGAVNSVAVVTNGRVPRSYSQLPITRQHEKSGINCYGMLPRLGFPQTETASSRLTVTVVRITVYNRTSARRQCQDIIDLGLLPLVAWSFVKFWRIAISHKIGDN